MVSLRFQTVRESWSTAEVTGKPLLANRQSYMATCHKGAVVIMGGGSYHAAAWHMQSLLQDFSAAILLKGLFCLQLTCLQFDASVPGQPGQILAVPSILNSNP